MVRAKNATALLAKSFRRCDMFNRIHLEGDLAVPDIVSRDVLVDHVTLSRQ